MRSISIKYILCAVAILGLFVLSYYRFSDHKPAAKGSAKEEQSHAEPVLVDKGLDNGLTMATGYSNALTYYNQGDPNWEAFLYGGTDPMVTYGCGPTALAIAITSLTGNTVTPVDIAKWSAQNGYFSRGYGSEHALIPEGAKAYELNVEKLAVLTPEGIRTALSYHKLIIFLMGPGEFADSGHFIIAYGYLADGTIQIADPASAERSALSWAPEELIAQLMTDAKAGGPAWVLSK